jgi:hypothetical protein
VCFLLKVNLVRTPKHSHQIGLLQSGRLYLFLNLWTGLILYAALQGLLLRS